MRREARGCERRHIIQSSIISIGISMPILEDLFRQHGMEFSESVENPSPDELHLLRALKYYQCGHP